MYVLHKRSVASTFYSSLYPSELEVYFTIGKKGKKEKKNPYLSLHCFTWRYLSLFFKYIKFKACLLMALENQIFYIINLFGDIDDNKGISRILYNIKN